MKVLPESYGFFSSFLPSVWYVVSLPQVSCFLFCSVGDTEPFPGDSLNARFLLKVGNAVLSAQIHFVSDSQGNQATRYLCQFVRSSIHGSMSLSSCASAGVGPRLREAVNTFSQPRPFGIVDARAGMVGSLASDGSVSSPERH